MIEGCFKRKNDQHGIHKRTDLFHTRSMPCPHLRTDIVHDLDIISFCNARKPEIESRIINQDQHIRLLELHDLLKSVFHCLNEWKMFQHFHKTHKSEFADVVNNIHSFALHLITADTVHIDSGRQAFQLPHHTGAMQIARCFAGNDHHTLNHVLPHIPKNK